MPLRFLLDEDSLDRRLWHAIQTHNVNQPEWAIDILRVGDEGAPGGGTSDLDLIVWCSANGRVIISHDRNTLIRTHDDFVRQGNLTPGVLIQQSGRSVPDVVEAIALNAHCGFPEEFESCCRFLPE